MRLLRIVIILIICSVLISLLTPTGYIVLKPFKNERCTMGYVCLNNTLAYQFGNCKTYNAKACNNGCRDGKCLSAPAGI